MRQRFPPQGNTSKGEECCRLREVCSFVSVRCAGVVGFCFLNTGEFIWVSASAAWAIGASAAFLGRRRELSVSLKKVLLPKDTTYSCPGAFSTAGTGAWGTHRCSCVVCTPLAHGATSICVCLTWFGAGFCSSTYKSRLWQTLLGSEGSQGPKERLRGSLCVQWTTGWNQVRMLYTSWCALCASVFLVQGGLT